MFAGSVDSSKFRLVSGRGGGGDGKLKLILMVPTNTNVTDVVVPFALRQRAALYAVRNNK